MFVDVEKRKEATSPSPPVTTNQGSVNQSVLAFHKGELVPTNVVVSTAKTILVQEMRSLSEKEEGKRLHQVHQVVKENHATNTLTVQGQKWNLEAGQKWKHVF